MDLVGIKLSDLPQLFSKVPAKHDKKPVYSFDLFGILGEPVVEYLEATYENVDPEEVCNRLPSKVLAQLSIDHLAKTIHSSKYISEAENKFEANPIIRLMSKIKSSIWRWGCLNAGWNEMVDAYEGLRRFDLGIKDMSVTLDHTNSFNHRGPGIHSEVFFDGAMAFLVHYKGEHVMTIGFSIAGGRRVLLQQVQLKKQSGNRWLFRMPANRIEMIIDCFRSAFPKHQLHVADGTDIVNRNLSDYRGNVVICKRLKERYEARIEKNTADEDVLRYHAKNKKELAQVRQKIRHLTHDRPRISAFYADAGRYRLADEFAANDIRHYAVAA